MKRVFKFSLSILAVLLLFSCSKEEENLIVSKDTEKDAVIERIFQHEKCLELSHGDYTVTYCIQSDLEEEIDKVLAQKPYIKVTPYNDDNTNVNRTTENVEIKEASETPYDIAEVIKESNIPTGYQLQILYELPLSGELNKSNSYRNRYYTNSGAKGIIVRASSHKVPCHFYSRGCCWYSYGWYDRGNRTMSTKDWHTTYHKFKTTTYTNYHGARMKAYTTVQAWNALQKSFIY